MLPATLSSFPQARPIRKRAISIADTAKLRKSKTFDTYVASVKRAIDKRRQQPHGPLDAGALTAISGLAPALAKLDPRQAQALRADIERPQKLLRDGGKFRDAQGPDLALIPLQADAGDRLDYAFGFGVADVTRAAYARFAKATGRPASRCRETQGVFARSRGLSWEAPGFAQADDHPVVCVSWQDAKAYADWLSRQTGERYRLPTQQEWLHVAQANSAATCGNGNFGKDRCDDGFENTAPVGRYPPTRYGLLDVIGNVAVWTQDCASPEKNGDCRERAIRGLSWDDDRDPARVWKSSSSGTDVGYATIGFRVVRELSADNAQLAKH